MTHLVLGGTGTVGSAVVRGLLAKGEPVRVLTRSADHAKKLPAGATSAIGDLTDPTTYDAIFPGARTLFLLNAVAATELQEGLCALAEARKVGVKRLVYLSVQDVEKGPHLPHFASKIAIEAAIKGSGIPYTILRPNNYYQNDAWFTDAMTKYGVYPQPLGKVGVSRVDVRDIADAAVNALLDGGHEGKTYALAGPDATTGESCAASWAKALGKDVKYAGDDLVAWATANKPYLPAWMIYDFAMMYAMFQEKGLAATPAQLAETAAAAGHPPRTYDAYVAETAASLGA
jgi:uncharacterized protein YbjT (DUF2867 family)